MEHLGYKVEVVVTDSFGNRLFCDPFLEGGVHIPSLNNWIAEAEHAGKFGRKPKLDEWRVEHPDE
jgi:hypothetical protein